MRALGLWLMVIGAMAMAASFAYPVHTPLISFPGSGIAGIIARIRGPDLGPSPDKIAIRTMLLIAAATVTLIGAIFTAAGELKRGAPR